MTNVRLLPEPLAVETLFVDQLDERCSTIAERWFVLAKLADRVFARRDSSHDSIGITLTRLRVEKAFDQHAVGRSDKSENN